jgi:radical SAM protein with 4Fe4S-binding SPASM domain
MEVNPIHSLIIEYNTDFPNKIYFCLIDNFKDLMGIFINISCERIGRNFFELLRYIKKADIDIGLRVTKITECCAKKLKEIGIRAIMFNVNNISEKKRETSTTFTDSILQNVEKNIKICQKYKIPVEITTILTKKNIGEIEKLIEFCLNREVVNLIIQRPVILATTSYGYEYLDPITYRKFLTFLLQKMNEVDGKMLIVLSHFPHKILLAREIGKETYYSKIAKYGGCSAGLISCAITKDGNVVPCLPLREVIAGNIIGENFKDIWENSPVFKLLRNRENLKGKCGKCKYKNLCGGCRAEAYYAFGDLLEEDPTCWL